MKSHTELVGVVNVTPDSFSDGGNYMQSNKAVARVNELFGQGASMVDIGGESTRPDAKPLTPDEEWRRISIVIGETIPVFNEQISVDTYHPEIVQRCLEFGRFVVNDVTGFNNPAMQNIVTANQLPCIVSHLPSTNGNDIQQAHKSKEISSVDQVVEELLLRAEELSTKGLDRSLITLDPGIGFGKTMSTNWQLLGVAHKLQDYPVMIGFSNKRFLKTLPHTGERITALDEFTEDEMEEFIKSSNRSAAKVAINSGAKYLRVHDPSLYSDLVR